MGDRRLGNALFYGEGWQNVAKPKKDYTYGPTTIFIDFPSFM